MRKQRGLHGRWASLYGTTTLRLGPWFSYPPDGPRYELLVFDDEGELIVPRNEWYRLMQGTGPNERPLLANSLLAERFAKKQSMQWTPEGAHLLLQIRSRTLNGDLAPTFRNSYPDFSAISPLIDGQTAVELEE